MFIGILIILAISLTVIGSGYGVGKLISAFVNRNTLSSAKSPEAVETNTESWAAAEVKKTYASLPQEHRPAYDVQAIVTALETKHGKSEVHSHFAYRETDFMYETKIVRTFMCDCKVFRDYRGQVDEYYDDVEACLEYPEYEKMIDAMHEIINAIRERERIQQEADKQAVLDGLASDLEQIAFLTKALKMETQAIEAVTKEIRP